MRVAVVGPGGIGGVLAAAAADAGHEVELRVRTPFDVLMVQHGESETVVAASVSSTPAGPVADVVFVVVKATDTASVTPHLAAICGPDTLTVAVQNGLDQAARMAASLPAGAGPVSPAIAYIAAEKVGPGKIHHIHGNLLMCPAEYAARVAEAVNPSVRVRPIDDFVTESWRKLMANLLGNPITAITLRHMDVMRSPGIAELARNVLLETVAVARAEGANLTDDEMEQVLEGVARYGPETASSMLYDRQAGRPMEHHYLTGEVVRRGAAHGIPVPVNAALLALLDAIEHDPATPDQQR